MSSLPNVHLAVVEERKVTAYLLSESHPAGRFKAAFFRGLGFRAASWQVLRDALVAHALASDVVTQIETVFGTKYIVDGPLSGRDGRAARLRTIWFVAAGGEAPRLVTAYPVPGAEQ